MIVDATWVKCMNKPRGIGDIEVKISERNFTCIQCEFSPSTTKEDIVPLTVSLLGDFTDIKNSVPFRYYREVFNITNSAYYTLDLPSIRNQGWRDFR